MPFIICWLTLVFLEFRNCTYLSRAACASGSNNLSRLCHNLTPSDCLGPLEILGNLGAPNNGRFQILSMFHSLTIGPRFLFFHIIGTNSLLIELMSLLRNLSYKGLNCVLPRPRTAIGGMNCDLLGARAAC